MSAALSFFSLVFLFLFPWYFFVALACLGFSLSVFCLFYRDFKGSESRKILDVFEVFLWFFKKTREKKDRVQHSDEKKKNGFETLTSLNKEVRPFFPKRQ